MDVQPKQLTYAELEVVGSTIVFEVDDLPRRLSPIYRHRADPECMLVPQGEDADVPPPMSVERAGSVQALVETGDAVLFQHPINAKPHHWVVQLEYGAPPEYLLDTEAHGRLRLAARQALDRVAVALGRRDRAAALHDAWYAHRADPSDPLPLLTLIELLRGDTPAEEVAIIERDLAELHPSESIRLAQLRATHEASLHAIADLLTGRRNHASFELSYLHAFQPRADYLSQARALYHQPLPTSSSSVPRTRVSRASASPR